MDLERNLAVQFTLEGKGFFPYDPIPVGPAGEHASVGGETGHNIARPKTFDKEKAAPW